MAHSPAPKAGVLRTTAAWLGGTVGVLLQLAFFVLIVAVGVGSCWGEVKAKLRWVGLLDEADPPGTTVTLRELRGDRYGDMRIMSAVWNAAARVGLDPNATVVAMAVDPTTNAISMGDGAFVFTEGVGKLPYGVIDAIAAHEVSHEVLGHGRSVSTLASALDAVVGAVHHLATPDGESGRAEAKRWVQNLVVPAYSRAMEREADDLSVRILRESGYGSDAESIVAGAFQTLRALEGESGGGFFDSHPSLDERIARVGRPAQFNFELELSADEFGAAMNEHAKLGVCMANAGVAPMGPTELCPYKAISRKRLEIQVVDGPVLNRLDLIVCQFHDEFMELIQDSYGGAFRELLDATGRGHLDFRVNDFTWYPEEGEPVDDVLGVPVVIDVGE